MNVGQLRADLKHLPDDAPVVVVTRHGEDPKATVYQFVCLAASYESGTIPCQRLVGRIQTELPHGVAMIIADDDVLCRLEGEH